MSELTNRIRKHNSWRRGEHDDMCNAMQLGNDLDALSNDLDKLTEQNKMMREALNEIRDQPLSAPEIDDLIDKVLEATKC